VVALENNNFFNRKRITCYKLVPPEQSTKCSYISVPSPILVIVMTGTAVTAPKTKYRMDERRSDICRTKL
jgi:hypothetical protein